MVDKVAEGVKALLEKGKSQGHLTYDDINDILPDEIISPERVDAILRHLDDQGINLVGFACPPEGYTADTYRRSAHPHQLLPGR